MSDTIPEVPPASLPADSQRTDRPIRQTIYLNGEAHQLTLAEVDALPWQSCLISSHLTEWLEGRCPDCTMEELEAVIHPHDTRNRSGWAIYARPEPEEATR